MNFEERTNAIGTLLREIILPRYRRPEHLDDATARAELADMVADLNTAWPLVGSQRFGEIAEAMARAVRTTHTSRTWPTIAALTKALAVAIEPPREPTGDDEDRVQRELYRMVVEWWGKHGNAMPSVAKSHHAAQMVSDGVATAGQLRRGGFPIPDSLRDAAMDEPDPRQGAILADVHAMGARLRANMAPTGDLKRARAAVINASREPF